MRPAWRGRRAVRIAAAAALGMAFSRAHAADRSAPATVRFPVSQGQPSPLDLIGYLRQPAGIGRFPAVILLHGCGGHADTLDRNWGARLQAWGYASLTVDSFGPRGLSNTCHTGAPPGRVFDARAAFRFMAAQAFVDASHIALMGFSEGGILTLLAVEPAAGRSSDAAGFRAAIAFYPGCDASGIASVPTLVLNGALDDWSHVDACRLMVAQQSDIGVTRHKAPTAPITLRVIPGAYHKFDDPAFQPGHRYMGHWLAYDPAALATAADAVHDFLRAQLGTPTEAMTH